MCTFPFLLSPVATSHNTFQITSDSWKKCILKKITNYSEWRNRMPDKSIEPHYSRVHRVLANASRRQEKGEWAKELRAGRFLKQRSWGVFLQTDRVMLQWVWKNKMDESEDRKLQRLQKYHWDLYVDESKALRSH